MRPDAEVVVLRQMEECAREFHRYAARLKARGNVVNSGDKLMVYKVDSTVPDGPVLVTDSTQFVFAS